MSTQEERAPLPQFGGTVAVAPADQSLEASSDPGYVSSKPLLVTGSYGTDVEILARLLRDAGFPNKVAAGLAPPMLDDELMRIVRHWQETVGIAPHEMQGEAGPLVRRDHEGIVDAATWASLYGHTSHADAGQDERLIVDVRYPAGVRA